MAPAVMLGVAAALAVPSYTLLFATAVTVSARAVIFPLLVVKVTL